MILGGNSHERTGAVRTEELRAASQKLPQCKAASRRAALPAACKNMRSLGCKAADVAILAIASDGRRDLSLRVTAPIIYHIVIPLPGRRGPVLGGVDTCSMMRPTLWRSTFSSRISAQLA